MNLDKDKLVIEELSRMKSLFGYERGKVISEQNRGSGALALGDGMPTKNKPDSTYVKPTVDQAAANKAATDKAAADDAESAAWDAKPEQERITGVYCSVNSDGIITVNRKSWKGKTWESYLDSATPKVTKDQIAAARQSCPTAWLATQEIQIQTQTEQQRINGVYCSVRNGIITIERPSWKGKTWEQYVTDTKTTEDQIAIAKKSCRKTYNSIPAPQELKSKQGGVKSFQDWLVSNKFGNELGSFGADGKFGKFTKAAWDKHKDEYLNQSKESSDGTGFETYSASAGGDNTAPTGNAAVPATPASPTVSTGTNTAPTGNAGVVPDRDPDFYSGYQQGPQ